MTPAHMEAALHRLAQSRLAPETLRISIAAGLSTKRLEKLLGPVNPWIRAMPNTPSGVGKSMTVICGGEHATAIVKCAIARQIAYIRQAQGSRSAAIGASVTALAAGTAAVNAAPVVQ